MNQDTPKTSATRGDFWDPDRSYQRIALCDVEITMKVGLAEIERSQLDGQRVIVNVEMFSHKENHTGTDISSCLNYHPIHEYITRQWPNRPHTELLETLVEELVGVCFEDDRVEACRVSIAKPDIYPDTGASKVEFYRLRPLRKTITSRD